MKAIVIAAGMGNRLGAHTKDLPKCLLDIKGQPLIQYQIDALATHGVIDLAMVKGHQAEKLDFIQARTYINTNYRDNNILCSLMMAEPEMTGPFIASYSDILYDHHTVKALIDSPYDISLVVDTSWRSKYHGRTDHPESEAEKVMLDETGRIQNLGKHLKEGPNASAEFIGLFKFSGEGARILKEGFADARKMYTGKPFFNAPSFEKAYITDFMLYLLSKDIPVYGVPITKGWMEIDTEQDLLRARAWTGLNNN